MSRLDSFIRRMSAQRDCLNWAAAAVSDLAGPVLELGLGNGRTYDHLRELFPDREIFVFDRHVNAHPSCIPDADHMFQGEIGEQLPKAAAQLGRTAAMAHVDVGNGVPENDEPLSRLIAELLQPMLLPGAIVVAGHPLPVASWEQLGLPEGVPAKRQFIYRVTG